MGNSPAEEFACTILGPSVAGKWDFGTTLPSGEITIFTNGTSTDEMAMFKSCAAGHGEGISWAFTA